MRDSKSFGALFGSEKDLARAVSELARIGYARETLAVAARSSKVLDSLAHDLGIARIESGVHHDGMFADLARATGQRDAVAHDALVRELEVRGIDPKRASYDDERVRSGDLLLVVSHAEEDERAYAILAAHGADLGLANGAGLERIIPLRREILDVTKVVVVTSEVVVRTEIVCERKVIELELEREEYVIERRDPRTPNAPPQITRIPLRHEEAIVRKETVVTGEVVVRTEQFVDTSLVEETLRHEILRVDEASVGSLPK